MRIRISFLTVAFVLLFATISQALFPHPICVGLKDKLGDRPASIYMEFKEAICDKGCKPTISHWDKWAYNNAFLPVVAQVAKDMGVPQYQTTTVNLGKRVVKVVKNKCGQHLKGKDLCSAPEILDNFGSCLKTNLMPAIVDNLGSLVGVVQKESDCKEYEKYLTGTDLWEKVIPKYLNQYAKVCPRLK